MIRQWLHALLWYRRHQTGVLSVPEIPCLSRFIQRDSVCIDVGAHAGSWTCPLAGLVPDGTVHAVEALPYYAETLSKLFLLKRLRNVRLHNVAITAEVCRVPMAWKDTTGRRITGLTHIAAPGEAAPDVVNVNGIPLDRLLESETGRIDLIKVDVEGAEMGVFSGGIAMIERHQPAVYSELSRELSGRYGKTPSDAFEFFSKFGYQAYVLEKGCHFRHVPDVSHYDRNDVIFVPPKAIRLLG